MQYLLQLKSSTSRVFKTYVSTCTNFIRVHSVAQLTNAIQIALNDRVLFRYGVVGNEDVQFRAPHSSIYQRFGYCSEVGNSLFIKSIVEREVPVDEMSRHDFFSSASGSAGIVVRQYAVQHVDAVSLIEVVSLQANVVSGVQCVPNVSLIPNDPRMLQAETTHNQLTVDGKSAGLNKPRPNNGRKYSLKRYVKQSFGKLKLS